MKTPTAIPTTTPPSCPPEESLTACLLGALDAADSAAIHEHVGRCESCGRLFSELEKTVRLLHGALTSPVAPAPLPFPPERLALIKAANVARDNAALLPPDSASKGEVRLVWPAGRKNSSRRRVSDSTTRKRRLLVLCTAIFSGCTVLILFILFMPLFKMSEIGDDRGLGGRFIAMFDSPAKGATDDRLGSKEVYCLAADTDGEEQAMAGFAAADITVAPADGVVPSASPPPISSPAPAMALGTRREQFSRSVTSDKIDANERDSGRRKRNEPIPELAAQAESLSGARAAASKRDSGNIYADAALPVERQKSEIASTRLSEVHADLARSVTAPLGELKKTPLPQEQKAKLRAAEGGKTSESTLAEPGGLVNGEVPVTSTIAKSAAKPVKDEIVMEKALVKEAALVDLDGVNSELADDIAPPPAPSVTYEIRPFVPTAQETFSTFGLDVDTASFTRARSALLAGARPDPAAIRIEEFVNAFDYDYTPPATGNNFAIYAESAPSPFRPSLELLKIGIKGAQLGRDNQQNAVLTVVLDGSGSMNTPDRLGLARQALKLLVERLRPADRVAIVQFSAQPRLLLEPTLASDKERILAVLDSMQAGGATHLENGLKLGYEVAGKAFVTGAANRVLLLSDGVANVGAADAQSLLSAVAENRQQGIYLSVFGLGAGAYNDSLLEQLADKGDGTYVFLDSLAEAKRVLVDEFAASLFTIAKDVKIQVEFNPKRVASWRQIGYDNRQLTKEQFRDDTVDAGEIGAGQAATALYELVLQGTAREPIGVVRVRYHELPSGTVREIQQIISGRERHATFEQAPPRFRLAAAVAEFAELLRQSPYAQGSNQQDVFEVLQPVSLELRLDRTVRDLTGLVNRARQMSE